MRKQEAHVVRREDRRQQTALLAPFGTFGDKNTLAQQGPNHPPHHRRAHVVGCICCQDMPDSRRIVDKHGVYAKKRPSSECNVESVVRKDREIVALSHQQVTPSREVLGIDLGRRVERSEGIG
jgi:hypothetical protein